MANAQNWNKKKVAGNGNDTSLTRTIADYDEISVGGPFKVDLVSGKEGEITLKGDENLLEYVKTEVDGRKLKIYFDNDVTLKYGEHDINVTIPFEKINRVSFAGSGYIKTKDIISAEKFEIKFAGSGEGHFEVNCPNLKVTFAGSGDLKVTGKTTELEAKLAGSGDLDCSKLEAQNTDASVSGSGDLKVNCIKNLTAKIAGSGDIYYKGKPKNLDSKVVGSGDVTSF